MLRHTCTTIQVRQVWVRARDSTRRRRVDSSTVARAGDRSLGHRSWHQGNRAADAIGLGNWWDATNMEQDHVRSSLRTLFQTSQRTHSKVEATRSLRATHEGKQVAACARLAVSKLDLTSITVSSVAPKGAPRAPCSKANTNKRKLPQACCHDLWLMQELSNNLASLHPMGTLSCHSIALATDSTCYLMSLLWIWRSKSRLPEAPT